MKQLLLTLSFLFLLLPCAGQIIADPSSWIDYDKTYYKIKLSKTGLYRIPYSTLQTATLPLVGSEYKLYHRGQEVPLYVTNNGNLTDGDYIEFFGKKTMVHLIRNCTSMQAGSPRPPEVCLPIQPPTF